MAIFKLTKDSIVPLPETQLAKEGILERKDLQRLLRTQMGALSSDLMLIAEEYGEWIESGRRIDLLCIDKQANLVVVELKRTDDGGHMELQAIRYAAMVSKMTFAQLVQAHEDFLAKQGKPTENAQAEILEFLGWDEPQEKSFASEVRIILAAADFSKELTTSVLWLNDYDLDIRCIRLKPYKDDQGAVLLDVQQLIPLPEASNYQTQIKAKEQAGRAQRTERHDLRFKFWSQLLPIAKVQSDLHASRTPTTSNVVGVSIRPGLYLNYVIREKDSQVELYIDRGNADLNVELLRQLESHKGEIESTLGSLEWQDLPESRACKIRKVIEGGYRSLEQEWPKIQEALVDAMNSLDKTLKPYIQNLNL